MACSYRHENPTGFTTIARLCKIFLKDYANAPYGVNIIILFNLDATLIIKLFHGIKFQVERAKEKDAKRYNMDHIKQ